MRPPAAALSHCTRPFSMAVNVFWVERSRTALYLGLKTFHCIAVGIQYLYAERIRCLSKSWSVVEYCCRHRDYIICFFGPNEGCIREKSNQRPECVMSSYEKTMSMLCNFTRPTVKRQTWRMNSRRKIRPRGLVHRTSFLALCFAHP